MSWRENRQRKRIWYAHYYALAAELAELCRVSALTDQPVAAEAILKMFFDLYERRRLHKRRRAAYSAWASLELAARDLGLTDVGLRINLNPRGKRPPSIGEFGSATKTSTSIRNADLPPPPEPVEPVEIPF